MKMYLPSPPLRNTRLASRVLGGGVPLFLFCNGLDFSGGVSFCARFFVSFLFLFLGAFLSVIMSNTNSVYVFFLLCLVRCAVYLVGGSGAILRYTSDTHPKASSPDCLLWPIYCSPHLFSTACPLPSNSPVYGAS